jgi:Domain of unknown function (DUF6916)
MSGADGAILRMTSDPRAECPPCLESTRLHAVEQQPLEQRMNLSRRDLLRSAATTLLTGASSVAAVPALAAADRRGGVPAAPTPGGDRTSRAAFARQVGTQFRIQLGALESRTLRLRSVSDLGPAPAPAHQPAPGREGFSLLFSGPAKPLLSQATYPVDHPRLGSFLLFLVPVGLRSSDPSYEAVINRLWP